MNYTYNPSGVCSSKINFDIDDKGKVRNVKFTAGCSGNLQALAVLVEGADAMAVAERLKGIQCGSRGTSCADQFARALEERI